MKITIPPAALEAGKRCVCLNGCGPDVQCDYCTKTARAAFNAMVEAWPGRDAGIREQLEIRNGVLVLEDQGYIILPIPQEASNG